jgi:branched-chain amino acid transport system ATP-binding protein
MFELDDLKVSYGKVEAVRGISLHVDQGEIVSFVGSNGAGKTTTLRAASGMLRASGGAIRFQGRDITRLKPHEIVRLGISHVPEGRRVFRELTVMDNLRMGAYLRRIDARLDDAIEQIFTHFPRLKERRGQLGGTLSGGEQQMLSLGRALISGPKFLMIDEPSFGLAPLVVEEISRIVLDISRNQGITVLLVEQNVQMAFAVSQRTYVMENGCIVLSGRSDEVARNPHVRTAYLGLD